MKNNTRTQSELIADMKAAYPGIFARPGGEFGRSYAGAVWTGGEATMPDGAPIFCGHRGFEDGYDGGVHDAFTAWLESRGWYLEKYDGETMLLYPDAIHEPYRKYEAMKRDWVADHPVATPEEYTEAMKDIARKCGV